MAGWTDRLKSAWERVEDVAGGAAGVIDGSIDLVVDLAQAPFVDDEYDGFFGTLTGALKKSGAQVVTSAIGPDQGLGALIGGLPRQTLRDPANAVLGGLETAYREGIGEPISTLVTLSSQASEPGDGFLGDWSTFLDPDEWRQAYKTAQHRSPGQAIAAAFLTKDIEDEAAVEAAVGSAWGQLISGTSDAIIRWKLDPTVIAGKGMKVARNTYRSGAGLRSTMIRTPDDIAAAMDSRRVNRFLERIDEIKSGSDDATVAAGRIRDEMFAQHTQGAAVSTLLAQAPDLASERLTLRALMGDWRALAQIEDDLPAQARAIRDMVTDAGDMLPREAGALVPVDNLDEVFPALDTLRQWQDAAGSVDIVPRARATSQARSAIGRSDFYQNSPLTRPVRSITNMMPQHWLNLNDQRSDIGIMRVLRDARLSQEEQFAWRGEYMRAATPAARQRVALRIENRVTEAVLTRHGATREEVQAILTKAMSLREDAMGALRNRVYDARGRGRVTFTDIDGTDIDMALPLHVTQQADLLPMVNVRHLEQAAKAAGEGGWSAFRLSHPSLDTPEILLDGFYRLWRPATLLRVGWPTRVLADEQLRVLAKIGALAQVKNYRRSIPEQADRIGSAVVRRLPVDVDAAAREAVERRAIARYRGFTVNGVDMPGPFGAPGDRANVFHQLNSSAGTFRELAGASEDSILATLRQRTGSWKVFSPVDDGHLDVWADVLNKQIGQSAFARVFLEGGSVDDGVAWLRSTAGAAYAHEMGWKVDDFAEHADDVFQHVNDYAPAGVREALAASAGGKVVAGAWVRAADRSNYGRVVSISGDTATVHFVNKAEGTEATVSLPVKDLVARSADDGGGITAEDLAALVPDASARPFVHGEELAQALGDSELRRAARNIIAGAWESFGRAPTDVWSRNPFFDAVYRSESERLIGLLDDQVEITQEVVNRIAGQARRKALDESKKVLYDLAEKSQFAHVLRFWSPFYMAFQEVGTRWAGLAYENPAFVARMRLAWNSPEKAGLVTDENGNHIDASGRARDPLTGDFVEAGSDRYITLPFSIPGLPTQGPVKFNKKMLNLILTGSPGVGPAVQIPVNEIVKDRPDLADSVKFILPFGTTQEWWRVAVPGTLKNLYTNAAGEEDRQYRNSWGRIASDRYTDYLLGKRDAPPTAEEVTNATDALYKLRAFVSWVSPFAPIYDSPYQAHINYYRNLQQRIRDEGEFALGRHEDGTAVTADEKFLDTWGEDFFYLTVSFTESRDGVPPTAEGFAARKKYLDLIERFPDLGGLIIGAEGAGEFSRSVYDYQLAHSLTAGSDTRQREGKTLDQMLGPEGRPVDPALRLGWLDYGRFMDQIDAERVRRGLPNLGVAAARDLRDAKNQIIDQIAARYPEWWEEFNKRDALAFTRRLEGLTEIAEDDRLSKRPDIRGLQDYLVLRREVIAELAARESHDITSTANQDLAAAWETLKAQVVERNPAFASLFYRYLERDPMEVEG